MFNPIFGNDNAESDSLLYECSIRRSPSAESKPILMGRWGTGKTALLLLRNKALQQQLAYIDPRIDRDWLISEKALDIRSLHELRKDVGGSSDELKRALEELWKSEIVRIAGKLLTYLRPYYGNPQGKHWDAVSRLASAEIGNRPIWSHASAALRAILAHKLGSGTMRNAELNVQSLIDTATFDNVQQCLRDVSSNALQICVAIEPIETPTSALEEDNSLAQTLVTALLNCFRTHFEPSERQLLRLQLSIPWHRYDTQILDLPQKLDQYIARLKWNKAELRKFIVSRIEWELQRVGNLQSSKGGSDAWDALFPAKVTNGHCDPAISEGSFSYIVRHTHHRARHLQSLARKVVDVQANISDCSEDDVLRGKYRITVEAVRSAVKQSAFLATDELLTEAQRKMPFLRDLVRDCLAGIAVPFSDDELYRRWKKSRSSSVITSYSTVREMLFTSGFLGIMTTPNSPDSTALMNTLFDEDNRRTVQLHDGSKPLPPRWFWFHYNCEGDLASHLDRVRSIEDTVTQFVVHPKTFEFLHPASINKSFPVGI